MAALITRAVGSLRGGLRGLAASTPLASSASAARRGYASSGSDEHTFEVMACKGHKLEDFELPSTEATVTTDELNMLYEQMSVIRRMETTAGESYREKKIRGFLHLYSGQEAIACGVRAGMSEVDTVITAYRCHGWAHVHGATPTEILAELYGHYAGVSNGKGGSMHMYGDKFFGGNGIVGAQVPVGAGIALAHKYKGDGGVNFSFYGDGASNQGQVFEAYNMAKLWNLPAVFVCENNKYGMGTHDHRSSASTAYYTRGDYIPGIWVDGMDVLAVKNATEWAIKYAKEHGPLVIEMETYRYHGHSMSDPDTTYRTREEIKDRRQTRDPINLQKDRMVEAGIATEEELKAKEKAIRKDIKKAASDAWASGPPPESELTANILVGETPTNIRGCDPFTTYNAV
eukprot:UC1_evm1s2184